MPGPTRNDDGESGRTYTITLPGGEVVTYPSVTSVLSVLAKPYLVPWASKCSVEYIKANMPRDRVMTENELNDLLAKAKDQHNWIKEEAGNIGSRAHALVEEFLHKGCVPDLAGEDDRVRLGVQKYCDWWNEKGLSPIATEMIVYHTGLKVAGTLDCVAADNGKVSIIDLKTSNYHSKEYGLQVVAYKACYEQMTDCEIDDIYIVRVGKDDAEIDIRQILADDYQVMLYDFAAVRQVFCWVDWEKRKDKAASVARKAVRDAEREAKSKAKIKTATRLRPV